MTKAGVRIDPARVDDYEVDTTFSHSKRASDVVLAA